MDAKHGTNRGCPVSRSPRLNVTAACLSKSSKRFPKFKARKHQSAQTLNDFQLSGVAWARGECAPIQLISPAWPALNKSEQIRAFIAENEARLKAKD
jgi:hypothetical protein